MPVDLGFPLTLEYVRIASAKKLLDVVKSSLQQDNPIALVHPHGFYVVLLGRNQTEEWRFHLWPLGPRHTTGMPSLIHSHDCHVASRILQGELTNIVYDVIENTNGAHPLYEVSYLGDRYTTDTSNFLRKTDTNVDLKIDRSETLLQGDTYEIERYAFHEAIVPHHIATATLVCMYGRSTGAVRVIGTAGYPEAISFTRTERPARSFVGELAS